MNMRFKDPSKHVFDLAKAFWVTYRLQHIHAVLEVPVDLHYPRVEDVAHRMVFEEVGPTDRFDLVPYASEYGVELSLFLVVDIIS
jgi:hypothetical protein